MRKLQSQEGFTLIELLVVVVIIGILASVAMPAFMGAQDKAKNSGVQANAHNVQVALERYAVDYQGKFPTTAEGLAQIMVDNYLNGNQYPPTPWGQRQASAGNIQADTTDKAQGQTGGPTPYGAGQSTFAATPTMLTYGAMAYANGGTAQEEYDVVASGKRTSNSICLVHIRNY